MSELVAFIFTDRYRAPEVLNELRRREGLWSEDLDQAAVFFMSEQSKFVTGQVLAVDGGWSVSEGQINPRD